MSKLKQQLTKFSPLSAAIVLLFAAVMSYVIIHAFAASGTATLYTSPGGTQSTIQGSTFTVNVRISTGSNVPVTGAAVYMTYPANKLSVQGVNYNGSPYNVQLAESNANGTLRMDRGAFPMVSGGDNLFASVTFKSIASGSAPIGFASNSVVTSGEDDSNILAGRNGVTYNIAAPQAPPPAASPSSPQAPAPPSGGSSSKPASGASAPPARGGTPSGGGTPAAASSPGSGQPAGSQSTLPSSPNTESPQAAQNNETAAQGGNSQTATQPGNDNASPNPQAGAKRNKLNPFLVLLPIAGILLIAGGWFARPWIKQRLAGLQHHEQALQPKEFDTHLYANAPAPGSSFSPVSTVASAPVQPANQSSVTTLNSPPNDKIYRKLI